MKGQIKCILDQYKTNIISYFTFREPWSWRRHTTCGSKKLTFWNTSRMSWNPRILTSWPDSTQDMINDIMLWLWRCEILYIKIFLTEAKFENKLIIVLWVDCSIQDNSIVNDPFATNILLCYKYDCLFMKMLFFFVFGNSKSD